MKLRRINSILIGSVFILLPLAAIADRCIEGDCVNGTGVMVYATGQKYAGQFKDGMRNGEGFMSMPGGRTLKGRFQNNSISEGVYTYPDGKRLEGKFLKGEHSGP